MGVYGDGPSRKWLDTRLAACTRQPSARQLKPLRAMLSAEPAWSVTNTMRLPGLDVSTLTSARRLRTTSVSAAALWLVPVTGERATTLSRHSRSLKSTWVVLMDR